MWSDEQLAHMERLMNNSASRHPDSWAELYRLARLGLAAEKFGMANFDEAIDWGNVGLWTTFEGREAADVLREFVSHPAWRRE